MKRAYPVVLVKSGEWYSADIPDFNAGTQGEDIADALCMAKDAIEQLGISLEDDGLDIPMASDIEKVRAERPDDIVSLVCVDLDECRERCDTIPSAGINFSDALQFGVRSALGMTK